MHDVLLGEGAIMDSGYYVLLGLGVVIAVIFVYIVYQTSGKAFIKKRGERDEGVGYTPWELNSGKEKEDVIKPESITSNELSTESPPGFFSTRTPS